MSTTARRPAQRLGLKDRLSRLTYNKACQLLGPHGRELLHRGSRGYDDLDLDTCLQIDDERFLLRLPPSRIGGEDVVVTLSSREDSRDRIHFECSECETTCACIGTAVSLILEEKTLLGLAEAPPERSPIECLSEEQLVEQALADRVERSKKEKFTLRSNDPSEPWTDYTITSAASGKSYRLALRGEEAGESYCSCPDFRTNTLGTCKHLLYALRRVRRRFSAEARATPPRTPDSFIHVHYGEELELHLTLADDHGPDVAKAVGKLAKGPIRDMSGLLRCLRKLERLEHNVIIYPDAEQLIEERLLASHLEDVVAEIRKRPKSHPLRKTLLKTPLLPYQLDGIAFAAGAGRAVLADDMGLGKTIQGIGVSELLAREAGIRRVLVVCPTSLKSQWRSEVERFSDRSIQLVVGPVAQRSQQYAQGSFFTVCNYEQVLRDIIAIEQVKWDLIILDEGQRIKNWESKTARIIKGLKSRFALVLSGTPLENRLDELYSVVQFIDDRRLAPAFRFFHRHRVVDEKGKVLGYKHLDELRENLQPILLRRTRDEVLDQLPPRTSEVVRIPPTEEQLDLHRSHMQIVSTIARKSYISEMDLLRMRKSLLMCRMAADSTTLVDKEEPGYSPKLERLKELIEQLFEEPDRKAVLFSEWTTMLDLIEPILKERMLDFVRLDGKVPQKKRQALVNRFQKDPDCRLFLTTNAGSTGLNLQAANTVINVDLPWNPAVLEQRVARAHRMGQKNPVQVYVLLTEQTIEESLLATLSAKNKLSLSVLDAQSDVSEVELTSGIEELKRRLEVLLGKTPDAAIDESRQRQLQDEEQRIAAQRERVAQAGGEMLGAAFSFLGEIVGNGDDSQPPESLVSSMRDRLAQCAEEDSTGKQRLSIVLPNRKAHDGLATSLAKLLAANGTGA
ncbi:RNA polymerase-associated protein RapA [Planctomycetes bacterium Pan216]|uniref:RNA polymerase-associated protein RapA n=1 Tax=Kolteria novifilia TaxID=2527975 RepID=A0A518AZH9_9BACT|nr:RNA polymerase-associated protein RapA [Planctomycetes bacterium Pan216]